MSGGGGGAGQEGWAGDGEAGEACLHCSSDLITESPRRVTFPAPSNGCTWLGGRRQVPPSCSCATDGFVGRGQCGRDAVAVVAVVGINFFFSSLFSSSLTPIRSPSLFP